jgi:hypothetical protein
VQEALPRSTKQEDYLGTPNTAQNMAKEVSSKADVWGRHKASILPSPISPFFDFFQFFKSSYSSILKTFSIHGIKRAQDMRF